VRITVGRDAGSGLIEVRGRRTGALEVIAVVVVPAVDPPRDVQRDPRALRRLARGVLGSD